MVNTTPREAEYLMDKIDMLDSELSNAVRVAFWRGAHEWVRLNYPKMYPALAEELKSKLTSQDREDYKFEQEFFNQG